MTDTALQRIGSTELAAVEQIDAAELALVKATVFPDATSDAMLKMFFYDCLRRGTHPMDKMIHPTVRKGRYVPITSIDFLRSQASDTGEHGGTDDAIFTGDVDIPGGKIAPHLCTVTVYRIVKGVRCPFTATARWDEYYPGSGEDGFMWRKMPHGQLAKCTEGLALRKAFPREIRDLRTDAEFEDSLTEAGRSVLETTDATGLVAAAVAPALPAASGAVVVDDVVPEPEASPPPAPATLPARNAPINNSAHDDLLAALQVRFAPLKMSEKLAAEKAGTILSLMTKTNTTVGKLRDLPVQTARAMIEYLKRPATAPPAKPAPADDAPEPARVAPSTDPGASWDDVLAIAEPFEKATKLPLLAPAKNRQTGEVKHEKQFLVAEPVYVAAGFKGPTLLWEAGEEMVSPQILKLVVDAAVKYVRDVQKPGHAQTTVPF